MKTYKQMHFNKSQHIKEFIIHTRKWSEIIYTAREDKHPPEKTHPTIMKKLSLKNKSSNIR